jgi:hypothetical protein
MVPCSSGIHDHSCTPPQAVPIVDLRVGVQPFKSSDAYEAKNMYEDLRFGLTNLFYYSISWFVIDGDHGIRNMH